MNTDETLDWVTGLLPGTPSVVARKIGPSFPKFTAANLRLGGDGSAPPETVAMTIDAARIDSLLETENGHDLRAEYVTVVTGHSKLATDLVVRAATMVSQNPDAWSPQPGTILEGLAQDLNLPVVHGLLVVPFLWPDGVPHLIEEPPTGQDASSEALTPPNPAGGEKAHFSHPGRITVALQLVMLTDQELAYLKQHGLRAAQSHFVAQGINLNDPWR